MKGRIIGFEKGTSSVTITGIKGRQPYKRVPGLGYYNGYGGFTLYSEPVLMVRWITETGKREHQDIYSYVRSESGRQKITQKYIDRLTELNVGKVVDLKWKNDSRNINLNQLEIPE